jgi:hypothetical protein
MSKRSLTPSPVLPWWTKRLSPSSVGDDYPPPGNPDGDPDRHAEESFWNISSVGIPSFGSCFRATLGMTVALYILNQKHLLPRPLSAIVSKVLFWPTLPITVARRIGRWETVIDDTVVMGGAPFGFAGRPERLHDEFSVSSLELIMCAL